MEDLTWASFKKWVEEQGVKDNDPISWIDVLLSGPTRAQQDEDGRWEIS